MASSLPFTLKTDLPCPLPMKTLDRTRDDGHGNNVKFKAEVIRFGDEVSPEMALKTLRTFNVEAVPNTCLNLSTGPLLFEYFPKCLYGIA